MERIDVVYQAAARLRARITGAQTGSSQEPGYGELPASVLIERLCDALGLELTIGEHGRVMLGGAYARLQLWQVDQPELGGVIWLRPNQAREKQNFAIAHELGHYLLHRGEGFDLHAACNEAEIDERADASALRTETHRVEEYTPRARRELEANAFAAELLAPRALIRRLFATYPHASPSWLAARAGISPALASQRLVDAVFVASAPEALRGSVGPADARPEAPARASTPADLLTSLDAFQREAACASTPALVIAGPGTGKTATLVGRVAHLIGQRGLQPERILALTFSNRAAGEMRERLARHGLPGERMPVMTIHAFAANLLREYASRVPSAPDEQPLAPDFRILDQSDAFLLMEELLGELPLHYYRSLGNPTRQVPTLLEDFSRARDQLLTPDAYLALVEAMPPAPPAAEGEAALPKSSSKHAPPAGTFTPEQIGRARERALAYGVWDKALRKRGLLDFGGLIQRAVELLLVRPEVLAEVRRRYQRVLVDEYQDTNRAAAEFLLLVAGNPAQELWVVGDRNQSIYRWRGASPAKNLRRLIDHFPSLRVYTLRRCYRSVPPIVQLGSHMAARMADLLAGNVPPAQAADDSPTTTLLQEALKPLALAAHRQENARPAVLRGEFLTPTHESLGLAAAIQRFHTRGLAYSDQALLCRSHKQAYRLAGALAAEGVPVQQTGDFFERPEIKDALALVALAAGPDARGLLRAGALAEGMGYCSPDRRELASLIRALAKARQTLPAALADPATLAGITTITPTTRQALAALGEAAMQLRQHSSRAHAAECWLSRDLAAFLLRSRGYAWQLARIADGIDMPHTAPASTGAIGAHLAATESRTRAQAALAALGELIRLAARFDTRWNHESDFRTRLSRAVAHWYGTREAREQQEADPLSEQATPDAPPARCFLHYLDALRATETIIPVPAEDDAVHVLTLHASKGLEFPVVYLPGLVQGQFPPNPNHREETCPPGFREADAPGEREAEERCLFYVGVTRARDVVVFSYPKTDGKKPKTPSSLLELLEGALPEEPLEPLLSEPTYIALAKRAALLAENAAGIDDGPGDEDTVLEPHFLPHSQPKGAYHLSALEQYLECPRQYKYGRHYQLLDPAQSAVYRFHRYVRWGLSELRQLFDTMPESAWATIELHLRLLWEVEGPIGHAYDAFYWQRAQVILRHEWKRLADEQRRASRQIALAERMQVEMARCIVLVTADRMTSTPGAGTAAPTILSRLRTGRPHKADADDLRLPLYYLGQQQRQPQTPVRVELAYLGNILSDVIPDTGLPLQSDVMDVTDEARKTVEKYLKPDRKQPSRLDKLDRAAQGIEADQFAPRPDEGRCAVCPYFYICPADPEA